MKMCRREFTKIMEKISSLVYQPLFFKSQEFKSKSILLLLADNNKWVKNRMGPLFSPPESLAWPNSSKASNSQ